MKIPFSKSPGTQSLKVMLMIPLTLLSVQILKVSSQLREDGVVVQQKEAGSLEYSQYSIIVKSGQ